MEKPARRPDPLPYQSAGRAAAIIDQTPPKSFYSNAGDAARLISRSVNERFKNPVINRVNIRKFFSHIYTLFG
jgi:hypothetical protein